jgi:predicted nuclease of restriction endonuclease-like RecB superfamily
MLTKDLLRFQIRGARVHPFLVNPHDTRALAIADAMISVLRESRDLTVGEATEALEGFEHEHPLAPAFQKLLLDLTEIAEDDGSIGDRRRQWIETARAIRQRDPAQSHGEFQERIAQSLGMPFTDIQSSLYADLPEARPLTDFTAPTPESLLHRYNCATIQGLLLRARSVRLTINNAPLASRRRFFRLLKFHRLLCEVHHSSERSLDLSLSGPLSIFQQAQAYGLRLAIFFPHVLHLPEWSLSAEVHVRDRDASLALDHACGIQSHYAHHLPYIPEEFSHFLDSFNRLDLPWKAREGGELLSLGRESYCLPDFTLEHPSGRAFSVELFHRWHASALLGRLQILEKNSFPNLLVGISTHLSRDPKVQPQLANSRWFTENGFEFRDFPTPRAVVSLLNTKDQ